MKNKNKEKGQDDPKKEEKKLMKHFVEIGIPMHDLLYAHLRQANIGIEVGRSMFDDPTGAYITIDLINVLAAEWVQFAHTDRMPEMGESTNRRFDIPRIVNNAADKKIADGIKKAIEDGEQLRKKYDEVFYATGSDILNILAIKNSWDLIKNLTKIKSSKQPPLDDKNWIKGASGSGERPSFFAASYFDTNPGLGIGVMSGLSFGTTAKIIDAADKKPYKEKIEFKEEGSWMRDNVLGAVFCVKGIDRDCYIDMFDLRHPPLICTFLGKPKFKEGEKIFANQEDVFVVEKITYDDSYSQFRYHGTMRSGMAINARESLCGPYVEKKPRYSKGTMLAYNGRNHLGIVETIEYRPNIGEHIYFVRFATGGFSWDKESVFTEYIPKPAVIGKPAIFWNKIKSEALCGVLVQTYSEHYTPNRKLYFENACLLESLEQYELFVKQ